MSLGNTELQLFCCYYSYYYYVVTIHIHIIILSLSKTVYINSLHIHWIQGIRKYMKGHKSGSMDNLGMDAAASNDKCKIIRWIFNGVSPVGVTKIQFMHHRKQCMSITWANRLMCLTNSTDFRGFIIRGFLKIPRIAPIMTSQAMCILRNTEARSCIHCCSGQARSITYFECEFVALDIPGCIAYAQFFNLCPARLYKIFTHYLTKNTIFF